MWQRTDTDFVLIAHNKAAGTQPFSKAASLISTSASSLKTEHYDLTAGLTRSFESGQVVKEESEFLFVTTGTVRNVEITYVPLPAESLVVAHLNDITERKAWETALMESELKFRNIVDNAHEGIWTVDKDRITTFVNQRAADMLGYTREEMIGAPTLSFMFEEDHEEAKRRRAALTERDRFDFRMRHKDGSAIWVSVSGTPRFDEAGEFDSSIMLLSDITARRAAEQALKSSAGRLQALTEAAFDGVCISRGRRIIETSGRFAETLGYAPDELVGLPSAEIIAEPLRTVVATKHALDRSKPYLAYLRRKDGTVVPAEVCGANHSDDGEVLRVSAIRDVTSRMRLEREVIEISEREQTRIGRDLHDGLGQTLTGVSLSLGSLAKRLGADREASEELAAVGKLLAGAISDVRRIAKTLTPDIEGLGGFQRALESLAAEIRRSNQIDCHVTIAADCLIHDETAATHIYRITQEALSNAVRHSDAKLIELTLKRHKGIYSLEIADDGRGIGVDIENTEGMGFKNMRYRAHSLNGTIDVKPREGGGTRVVCQFVAAPSWPEQPTLRRA